MIFIDDHTFKKPFYDQLLHTFEYNYTEDSITIQYAGPNMILVRPSTHHYTLTHSTLIIDLYKVNSGLELVEMEYLKIREIVIASNKTAMKHILFILFITIFLGCEQSSFEIPTIEEPEGLNHWPILKVEGQTSGLCGYTNYVGCILSHIKWL